MKRQGWFLLSAVGLVLLLLSFPTNSRADTMREQYAGPLGNPGHGVGLLIATQNSASGFATSAVLRFGGASDVMPGGVGTLVGPDTYAGRPLFGVSNWGWLHSVWTGTSYVFPNCGGSSGGDSDPPENNSPVPTPEPATMLLLVTGLVGLLVYRRFSDVDM